MWGNSGIYGILAALLVVAGCGGSSERVVRSPAEGGSLVFVTTLHEPPYCYIDTQTREAAGIDVEIARAAAEKLGLPLEIRQRPFQDLLPDVKSGRADFTANAITITRARARNVAFSRPYVSDGCAFLYRTGEPRPTIPLAKNMRVGTMMASTCYFYLCDHGVDPRCYDDYQASVVDFKKGNLDAVFNDAAQIRETARQSNGAFSSTPLETRENYGVAVRKDYPALLEAVNRAIAEREAK